MPGNQHVRDTYRYKQYMKRERAKVIAAGEIICAHCAKPIDPSIPSKEAESLSMDHVTPLALNGDPFGPVQPAHLSCNARAGGGLRANAATSASTKAAIRHNGNIIYQQDVLGWGTLIIWSSGARTLDGYRIDEDQWALMNKGLSTRDW